MEQRPQRRAPGRVHDHAAAGQERLPRQRPHLHAEGARSVPEPDPELLEDPTADLRLTVSPTRADPGDRVVVDGTGYDVCVNGWQAALGGPATAESPPDGGSTDSRRSAELTVPAGAPPGEYQVVARCDFGTGLRPYGPTAVLRVGPEPTTTTSSTTSTTEPGGNGHGRDDDGSGPPGQETTTTSTTTTTTTVPEDGDEADAGA